MTIVTRAQIAAQLKGRRVLITGADGFMGSAAVDELLDIGAELLCMVRRTSRSSVWSQHRNLRHHAPSAFTLLPADVAEIDWFREADKFDPEFVFHMAADAYVSASFTSPREVFRANALGTLNVLEWCRDAASLERVIVVSSSEIYGPSPVAISEEALPQPTTPYAASKLAADRLAYSYKATFDLPVVICRPFNCYGPRHVYDVIPKFMMAALAGRPIRVNGDGLQSRDFTFITDTIRGLMLTCLVPGLEGEVLNLGTGRSTTIVELARLVGQVTGRDLSVIHGPTREGEVARLQCDPSKANSRLGWQATVSLGDGLECYWRWLCDNRGLVSAGQTVHE